METLGGKKNDRKNDYSLLITVIRTVALKFKDYLRHQLRMNKKKVTMRMALQYSAAYCDALTI